MQLDIYQIDAFANKIFEGNPAAVCPLENWLPDELMQSIASENSLSETAFFVSTDTAYHIRWFTPKREVDLCGHATLASAFVIFSTLNYKKNKIIFSSKSGELIVSKNGEWLEMDFPTQAPEQCSIPEQIIKAFKTMPIKCLKSQDYIVIFANENEVLNAKPDMSALNELNLRGVVITAVGKNYDFVNRVFAPKYGINEDSVTGSAFTQLIPYWSEKLSKKILTAKQVSARGGEVNCAYLGERVKISGKAVQYMVGSIEIQA